MGKKDETTQAIDGYVGNQIRWYRIARGLTQESLANEVGITYQQLYKYENGSNTASASRLADIARILKVNINQFFDGFEYYDKNEVEAPQASREHLMFLSYYYRIPSDVERRAVNQLIQVLSESRPEK